MPQPRYIASAILHRYGEEKGRRAATPNEGGSASPTGKYFLFGHLFNCFRAFQGGWDGRREDAVIETLIRSVFIAGVDFTRPLILPLTTAISASQILLALINYIWGCVKSLGIFIYARIDGRISLKSRLSKAYFMIVSHIFCDHRKIRIRILYICTYIQNIIILDLLYEFPYHLTNLNLNFRSYFLRVSGLLTTIEYA